MKSHQKPNRTEIVSALELCFLSRVQVGGNDTVKKYVVIIINQNNNYLQCSQLTLNNLKEHFYKTHNLKFQQCNIGPNAAQIG